MQHLDATWLRIGLATTAAVVASGVSVAASSLPACNGPAMKILHYETVDFAGSQVPAGDAIVEFTVDTSGAVSDPKVLNASDPRLEDYALRSATLWRYVAPERACRHRMQVLF